MRILNSVAVWGNEYARIFVECCLASQLADRNVPLLVSDHELTYHIITTRTDAKWLRRQPAIKNLAKYCQIDWEILENHKYDPGKIPTGPEGEKYSFLSLLQNISIRKSLNFDVLIFNYADFVWSNGSLTNTVAMMADGVDAVLSFCLPVDKNAGMRALKEFRRQPETGVNILDLPPRAGADIAIRCLHREAKLRYWNDPAFTVTPTYMLWPVGDEGVVVRAYHQTVLALRVKADDPIYREGIPRGSLDGYYTTLLADKTATRHAANSDDVFVFSLYDTIVESQIGGPSRQSWDGFDRDTSVRECLRGVVTPGQRKFALTPIEVRRTLENPDLWKKTARTSQNILEAFHENTDFDPEEYEHLHANEIGLDGASDRWRRNRRPALNVGVSRALKRVSTALYQRIALRRVDAIYRRVLVGLAGAPARSLKKILGDRLARKLRLTTERALFGRTREHADNVAEPVLFGPIDIREAKAMLSSGKWEQLVRLLLSDIKSFELVPNVTVSRNAIALMHIVSLSEKMITETSDMAELEATLLSAEKALRALTAEAPYWTESHRGLARNLWFQGRIEEAIKCFEDAERRLPALAKAAGWEPNDRVILPRNCAEVIGLMGHIDAFIKLKILNNDRRPYHLIAPQRGVVNQTFLEYWKSYLHVECPPPGDSIAPRQIEAAYTVNWNWVLPHGNNALTHVHRGIARIQRQWENDKRESLLRLKLVHSEMLDRQKAAWGMADKDWFVCLHVRSAGFYDEQDHAAQHFRNTHIDDYYPMIKWILDNGGWVVRMGDSSAPPLDRNSFGKNAGRVIDYAHLPEKSPNLDVALCASCRLFVSSPSGLHTVAHAFGRPACYVNYPVYAGFPWHAGEIFIPQRYFSRRLGRVLTLSEVLSSTLVHADHHFMLTRAGIELIHNSPTDILETVREALNPDEYTISSARLGTLVRQEFDRLNSEHTVDISGQLGLHFCSEYANELCPEIDKENVSSESAPHVSAGGIALSAVSARTPSEAWDRGISS